MGQILKKLGELDQNILFPIHPRTKNIISKNSIAIPPSVLISEPLSYFDFLKAESLSSKIITDSGGIQKEAFLLKKPCITVRPETEWIETVNAGWNILLEPDKLDFSELINNFNPTTVPGSIFGENVAQKMVELIKSFK